MKYTILGMLLLVLINVLPAQAVIGGAAAVAAMNAERARSKVESAPVWEELALPAADPVSPWTEEDRACLQRTIYGEARNQEYAGMLAVAATVVNRAMDRRWAGSLCSVVKQKGQFAGYWHVPKLSNAAERVAWDFAGMAADQVTLAYYELPEKYHSYLFFHEKTVKRFAWADYKGRIGDHVFYG